jgi:hypothetical protein
MRTIPIPAPTPHDDPSNNIVHGIGPTTATSGRHAELPDQPLLAL